jgi:methylamine dehydrogenase heavy chain
LTPGAHGFIRQVPSLCTVIGLGACFLSSSVALADSELAVDAASGEIESFERPGVATLPPPSDHWVWVPDRLLAHSLLYDGDSGSVLGMIDSPSLLTPQAPLLSKARREIYSVDVGYARGNRGARVDFLSIYDLETLEFRDEIVFPTRAATGNTAIGYSAQIGSRFIGVFNQFPATSIAILDLDDRRFVEEIGVSGCSGIYPIGGVRFATLCGDGTVVVVELTSEGRKKALIRSEKFFDTIEDPVFTSAGRLENGWIFVSFLGRVHEIDFTAAKPEVAASWSLLGDGQSKSDWRPGGLQLVSVHAASRRLFVVMHEGGPGSHKDAGPEIWSFDLDAHERLERIKPPALTGSFLGGMLGVPPDSFSRTMLNWVLPPDTVHSITVSQDASPILFVRNAELGAIGVVDANTGQVQRILTEAGLFGPTLRVP